MQDIIELPSDFFRVRNEFRVGLQVGVDNEAKTHGPFQGYRPTCLRSKSECDSGDRGNRFASAAAVGGPVCAGRIGAHCDVGPKTPENSGVMRDIGCEAPAA